MLDKIVALRREDLEIQKKKEPESRLRERLPDSPPVSFLRALQQDGVNIIAEIKFKSPSRGCFPQGLGLEERVESYSENGAAALSILTEERFFDGELDFLDRAAASDSSLPLLRKDFILEGYQVLEAAVHQASAYLLIVCCLSGRELADLIKFGNSIGLDPLVEVHSIRELDTALESGAVLLGVNNRDLKTFDVRLQTSFEIARRLEGQSGLTLVAESGISEYMQIAELKDAGFQAFLIGTQLMEANDPGLELRRLLGRESG